MAIIETKDISTLTNAQIKNKIKKLKGKSNKINNEEKELLEKLIKEAWRREIDMG